MLGEDASYLMPTPLSIVQHVTLVTVVAKDPKLSTESVLELLAQEDPIIRDQVEWVLCQDRRMYISWAKMRLELGHRTLLELAG